MRIIRRTFSNLSQSTLQIGRVGENLVTTLEVDVSRELAEFQNPSFELVLKVPAAVDPYPVLVDIEGGKLTYSFSGGDLSESGTGSLELLVYGENEELLKSTTANTVIQPSIIPSTYPGPLQKVIDDIREAIGKIVEKSAIEVVDDLPDNPPENKAVYLNGEGLYIYYENEWTPITSDNVLSLNSVVDNLQSLSDNIEDILSIAQRADELDPYGRIEADWGYCPAFDNRVIGFVYYNEDPTGEMYLNEGAICCVPYVGFYYSSGAGNWYKIVDFNNADLNYVLLNKLSINKQGKLSFDGWSLLTGERDDVTLLSLTEYNTLSLRDDFTGVGTLDDVPIYVLDNVGYGFGLYEDAADPSNCDCVSVGEVWDDETGLPVRFIRAVRSGTNYARWSRDCTVDGHDFSRGVWYTNNTATDAPSFAGFTPTALEVCGEWYDDLSDLPDKAASALRSLSQLVNVSAAAMGTIRVPENAVQRFAGSLKDGMHFSYTAHDDMTLDFPTLPWSDAVSVMLLDLHCLRDIALTLPREKMLDGGTLPNTTAGEHTLTFTYVPSAGKWSVGCVNRVQPQYWDDIPDTVIPLEDCTWTQIKSIAEHGYLNRAGQWCIRRNNEEEVWFEIGDEKTVALSSGETWTVQIWDFNHDDLADGSGKAPFTFGMSGVTANTYRLNTYNTTAGGWEECYFRTQTLPTIIALLPQVLQDALAYVTKSTSISQKNGNPSSRAFADTTDALFCPTLTEIGIDLGSYPGSEGGSKYSIFNTLSCATDSEYATRGVSFSAGTASGFSKCSTSGTRAYLADASTWIKMRLAFCI